MARFPAPFSSVLPDLFVAATTRTKPIRLHQVWQPAPVDVGEDDLPVITTPRRASLSSGARREILQLLGFGFVTPRRLAVGFCELGCRQRRHFGEQ
jgi:hypothetical protein